MDDAEAVKPNHIPGPGNDAHVDLAARIYCHRHSGSGGAVGVIVQGGPPRVGPDAGGGQLANGLIRVGDRKDTAIGAEHDGAATEGPRGGDGVVVGAV